MYSVDIDSEVGKQVSYDVLADWEDQHLARKPAGWIRREVKGR